MTKQLMTYLCVGTLAMGGAFGESPFYMPGHELAVPEPDLISTYEPINKDEIRVKSSIGIGLIYPPPNELNKNTPIWVEPSDASLGKVFLEKRKLKEKKKKALINHYTGKNSSSGN